MGRENKVLRSSLRERYRLGDILGRCESMQTVYETILKAASTDASVAIYGESGTGKELAARAIHANSARKSRRFLAVNCGAVQESLFEREFFGHRKGSFSGAHADAPGYLDLAAGGTLFLDEIGELTLNMQVKLLRAIEGGGYCPVGGTEPRVKDFRLISASNTPLSEKVAGGAMREDFFYRVQVIRICLPPLRHRRQDIPLLVEHFLRQMAPRFGEVRVPGRIMDLLMDHDWPGNVRELRNVLQRYATLGHLAQHVAHAGGAALLDLLALDDASRARVLEHLGLAGAAEPVAGDGDGFERFRTVGRGRLGLGGEALQAQGQQGQCDGGALVCASGRAFVVREQGTPPRVLCWL